MQVAYWPQFMTSYIAFTIKGQTKAAVAFKDFPVLHQMLEDLDILLLLFFGLPFGG